MFALDPILVIVWVLMKPVSLKKKKQTKKTGRFKEGFVKIIL